MPSILLLLPKRKCLPQARPQVVTLHARTLLCNFIGPRVSSSFFPPCANTLSQPPIWKRPSATPHHLWPHPHFSGPHYSKIFQKELSITSLHFFTSHLPIYDLTLQTSKKQSIQMYKEEEISHRDDSRRGFVNRWDIFHKFLDAGCKRNMLTNRIEQNVLHRSYKGDENTKEVLRSEQTGGKQCPSNSLMSYQSPGGRCWPSYSDPVGLGWALPASSQVKLMVLGLVNGAHSEW